MNNESRRDKTGRGSATESPSPRSSFYKLRSAGKPEKREPHKNVSVKAIVQSDSGPKGVTAMDPDETNYGKKGIDVSICSEEERKMSWMRETKIRLFMQMELDACRAEGQWLLSCHYYIVNNCPEECCPPMPLPNPSDYAKNFRRRWKMAQIGHLASISEHDSPNLLPTANSASVATALVAVRSPPRRPSAL